MATDTSTKEGDVPTVRDKNGAALKMPSDGDTGADNKGLRRSLRTSGIGNPAKDNVDRLTPGAAEQNEPKSIEEKRGKKDAQANGASPAASSPEGKPPAEPQVTSGEVDALVDHRVNKGKSTVRFRVRWKGSGETWEPEWNMQEDVPTLVYKYWAGLGGRDNATELDYYHVFRILQRVEVPKNAQPPDNPKDSQYRYKVQWVGYSRADSTWECDRRLQESAPDAFEEFQAKELAREAVKSQKRKNSRGPGRPHKKARGANNP